MTTVPGGLPRDGEDRLASTWLGVTFQDACMERTYWTSLREFRHGTLHRLGLAVTLGSCSTAIWLTILTIRRVRTHSLAAADPLLVEAGHATMQVSVIVWAAVVAALVYYNWHGKAMGLVNYSRRAVPLGCMTLWSCVVWTFAANAMFIYNEWLECSAADACNATWENEQADFFTSSGMTETLLLAFMQNVGWCTTAIAVFYTVCFSDSVKQSFCALFGCYLLFLIAAACLFERASLGLIFLLVSYFTFTALAFCAAHKYSELARLSFLFKHRLVAEVLSERERRAEARAVGEQAVTSWVCHEIRDPLDAIQLCVDAFLKDGAIAKGSLLHQHASTMQQCSKHILNVITNMLDLSKLSDGKMVVKQDVFGLSDCARSIDAMSRPLVRRDVVLTITHPPDLQLQADCVLLKQLLGTPCFCFLAVKFTCVVVFAVNLVCNAAQVTHFGFIEVVFTRVEQDLSIRVSDTSPGLNPAEIADLFQKYKQLGVQRNGGSGLGLLLAQQIAQAFQTEITVKSPWQASGDLGTQMEFRLPNCILMHADAPPRLFNSQRVEPAAVGPAILQGDADGHVATRALRSILVIEVRRRSLRPSAGMAPSSNH
jgi:signal transduction histidine kinase